MTERVYTEAGVRLMLKNMTTNTPTGIEAAIEYLKRKDIPSLLPLPEELEKLIGENWAYNELKEKHRQVAQLTIQAAVEAACERMGRDKPKQYVQLEKMRAEAQRDVVINLSAGFIHEIAKLIWSCRDNASMDYRPATDALTTLILGGSLD